MFCSLLENRLFRLIWSSEQTIETQLKTVSISIAWLASPLLRITDGPSGQS